MYKCIQWYVLPSIQFSQVCFKLIMQSVPWQGWFGELVHGSLYSVCCVASIIERQERSKQQEMEPMREKEERMTVRGVKGRKVGRFRNKCMSKFFKVTQSFLDFLHIIFSLPTIMFFPSVDQNVLTWLLHVTSLFPRPCVPQAPGFLACSAFYWLKRFEIRNIFIFHNSHVQPDQFSFSSPSFCTLSYSSGSNQLILSTLCLEVFLAKSKVH